jgi:hypothetical protein
MSVLNPDMDEVSQFSVLDLLTPRAMADGTQYTAMWSFPFPGNPAMIMHLSLSCGHRLDSQLLISVTATIPVPGNGLYVSSLMEGNSKLSTTCREVEERGVCDGGFIDSNASICCWHRSLQKFVVPHTRQ